MENEMKEHEIESLSDYERIEIENRLRNAGAALWAIDQAIAAEEIKQMGYRMCREIALETRKFAREEKMEFKS